MGARRRERVRRRPASSTTGGSASDPPARHRPRRHRVSLRFGAGNDNDELGEEEVLVVANPRPAARAAAAASAAAAGSVIFGLELESAASSRSRSHNSLDDGDDGDDENDDDVDGIGIDGDEGDRKLPANTGADAPPATSNKRSTPPLSSPILGLPPHFVSPPPSAQCAQPRRSSIRRPSSTVEHIVSDVVSPTNADQPPGEEKCKPKMRRNKLSFHSVQVREYSQVLGDHPCCQTGLPLSLGWDYDADTIVHNVDEYESNRQPHRVKSRKDMKVDENERREILSGVTETVVTEVTADGRTVVSTEETTAYTSMDLRRAERRLFRERRVSSRKMNSFFGSAASIGDGGEDVGGGGDHENGTDHQLALAGNTAPMSGKQRRRSFFAQEEITGISPHHE